jgi:hypothetical protein
MESKVKSQLVNKTYTASLDKIEEEDRDAMSELYRLPVSDHNIMIAPGKSIMSDSGIAYCYAYVIQQEKVICKLGVYEKKTDTMPMFFDLTTFPEGSLLLFEEYEMNPTKLLDFVMKESGDMSQSNIFDYLSRELFPRIQDKKKKLNETYSVMYALYRKVEKTMAEWVETPENTVDQKSSMKKELDFMKTILKLITATKKSEPTDAFIQTMKEKAADKTKLILSLLTLQPFFEVTFKMINPTEQFMNFHSQEETQRRWFIEQTQTPVLKVDLETHAFLGETTLLSVIPEESMDSETFKNEYKAEPEEYNPEPEEEPEEEPKEEPEEEPKEEPEEYNTEPKEEPEPVPVTRPEPVRRGQTPKIGVTKKGKTAKMTESKSEIRGTSMNTVFAKAPEPVSASISLNDPEPVTESKTDKLKLKVPKLKTKPPTKPATKTKTKGETNKE